MTRLRAFRLAWAIPVLGFSLVICRQPLHGQVSSDQAAALLVYPYVAVDSASGTDTWVQLTNASNEPVDVRCFYDRDTPECTGGQPGETCTGYAPPCSGNCLPGGTARFPFRVRLTPRQPFAWYVGAGLTELPLDGLTRVGPNGSGNAGTEIPPVPSTPLVGSLRCVVVDADDRPTNRNVLLGLATVERSQGLPPVADAAQYKAIGIPAEDNAGNGDDQLIIGGPVAEYGACPEVNVLPHFYDGAALHNGPLATEIFTTLALVPCGRSLPLPQDLVVHLLVFNEFEQRFSTSRQLHGQLVTPLSAIDLATPSRSIFSAGVAGTLTGQTRLFAPIGGLLAVAFETHRQVDAPVHFKTDAFNVHQDGTRAEADLLIVREPRCAGDCNADLQVSIDEIITGVNIALNSEPLDRCRAADMSMDGRVTVDEIIAAINTALLDCAVPTPPPSPVPTPVPTQRPLTSFGPEITHLGLAGPDDVPLQSDAVDASGRPIYATLFGKGISVIIEARQGTSRNPVGRTVFNQEGGLPDLQILVSRALGDGSPLVCGGASFELTGGVPGTPSLEFSDSQPVVDAINDLGCRATDQSPRSPCTRAAGTGLFVFVDAQSTNQFCLPIARDWAFQVGDTIVAARVRDIRGNVGPVREMVVRVAEH